MTFIFCWLAHVFLYESLLSLGNGYFQKRTWDWWYKWGLLDRWEERLGSSFILGITWSSLMFAVCYLYTNPAHIDGIFSLGMIFIFSFLQMGINIVKILPYIYQLINLFLVFLFGFTFHLLFE